MLNSLFGASSQFILAVVGFVLQRAFTQVFGIGLQGVYTTMTSVIMMLKLTESGIGAAINCRLYKPLAEHDDRRVIALMQMYGRIYRAIGLIIFTAGMILMPFLGLLVGTDNCVIEIPASNIGLSERFLSGLPISGWFIFGFLLVNTASSYFLAYKRSIIMADQRNYIVLSIHTGATVLMQGLQIALIFLTHDLALFLILNIVFQLLENATLAIIADRRYPIIRSREKIPVERAQSSEIWGNTRALLMHYIGNYAIDSADTIIISNRLGDIVAGVYSNYYMIIKAITSAVAQFAVGFTASFGNLLAEREISPDCNAVQENLYTAFRKAYFVTFIIANFAAVSLFTLLNDFIERIWMKGATDVDVTLTLATVAVLCLNFAMTCLAETLGSLRAAAGLFRPDRYLHLAMALFNVVISLILVYYFGIIGAFIGTTVCKVIKEFIVLPRIVYRDILGKKVSRYRVTYLLYLLTIAGCGAATYAVCLPINFTSGILTVFVKAVVCLIVPNLLCVAVWGRTAEFRYLVSLVKSIVSKFTHKKEIEVK